MTLFLNFAAWGLALFCRLAREGRLPAAARYRTRRVIPADWKPDFFAVKRTRPRLVGRSVKRATPHMLVLRV